MTSGKLSKRLLSVSVYIKEVLTWVIINFLILFFILINNKNAERIGIMYRYYFLG